MHVFLLNGCLHLRTEVRITQWSFLQPVCAYEAPGDPFSEFLAAVTQIPPKSVPTPQPVKLVGPPLTVSLLPTGSRDLFARAIANQLLQLV